MTMPRKRLHGTTTTDRPLRAAGYYRRSSEMQADNFSLDAQRRAVRTYCESRGWQLGTEYIDDATSGRTADLSKRPAFSQMLTDAEAGAFEVVVTHKLDRFARNAGVFIQVIERLERAGIAF